ncbi:TauD/TfdA family dioxygenase [Pseudoalteromonas sp. DY56-GL79]|uniref:TauD/TfdA family dioxygenase n=1 Tax=Pseudoalteromonas sp. DY56-GL79 TaxID=2967131 RepID=UPI00352AC938
MTSTVRKGKFSSLKKGVKPAASATQAATSTTFFPGAEGFPAVIQPTSKDLDPYIWAEANRDFIETNLLKYAGLVFRGFGLKTPQDFEQFASAIQPGLYGNYGDLPKKEGGKKTYKSTPYPENKMILYHNESSHLEQWPRKQWFFCELPSPVGGTTPIVDCRRMLSVLPSELVKKIEEKGLLYLRNFHKSVDVSWQHFYKTDSKIEVEERLRAAGIEYSWLENDGLQTKTKTHGVIVHPLTKERSFFNQVQLHHIACLEPEVKESLIELVGEQRLPRHVYFGDGSAISEEEMAIIGAAYETCAVRFDWQQGDVVMLDNMLAAHARDPFEGPRKIVVAMGDIYTQQELQHANNVK